MWNDLRVVDLVSRRWSYLSSKLRMLGVPASGGTTADAERSAAKDNLLPHGHCISPLATFALSSSDATPASVG